MNRKMIRKIDIYIYKAQLVTSNEGNNSNSEVISQKVTRFCTDKAFKTKRTDTVVYSEISKPKIRSHYTKNKIDLNKKLFSHNVT